MAEKVTHVQPVPLSLPYLQAATAAAHRVFPYDIDTIDGPNRMFPASLDPTDHDYRGVLEAVKVAELNYWLALEDGAPIAFTGIYRLTEPEEAQEAWLGWFGVVPEARRHGIGEALLAWTMRRARVEGAKVFKVYTSDTEADLPAHRLYEKLGFVWLDRVEPKNGYNLKFMRIEL
jgi:GNAT superfamily N-acetyltransferase